MAKRKKRGEANLMAKTLPPSWTELAKVDPTAETRKQTILDAAVKKKLNLAIIARKSGLSFGLLRSFMEGMINLPPEKAEKVASILGIRTEEIMTDPAGPVARVIRETRDRLNEETGKDAAAGCARVPDEEDDDASDVQDTAKEDGVTQSDAVETPLSGGSAEREDFLEALSGLVEAKEGTRPEAETPVQCRKEDEECTDPQEEKERFVSALLGVCDAVGQGSKKREPHAYVPSCEEVDAILTLCNSNGLKRILELVASRLADPGAAEPASAVIVCLLNFFDNDMLAEIYPKMWNVLMDPASRKGGVR